jgi:hypothetical protein
MPEPERENREAHRISVGHSQCNLDQIPTTDLLSKRPNAELYAARQSGSSTATLSWFYPAPLRICLSGLAVDRNWLHFDRAPSYGPA